MHMLLFINTADYRVSLTIFPHYRASLYLSTYISLLKKHNYCDANYVVIGKSHEKHIEEHIPKYRGILSVAIHGAEILVKEKRAAESNPKMTKELQVTLVWRLELQRLLEINHLPKYKQKSKKFVRQKLLEKIEWDMLKL